MSESKPVPEHEVNRLIKQFDNPIRRAKTHAAEQLIKMVIYPDIIPDADKFIHEVFAPVLRHFTNDTEVVRNICVQCIQQYVKALGSTKLHEMLDLVLTPIYDRLKEGVEPSETIHHSLMDLLLSLIQLISPTSVPSSWDAYFEPLVEPIITAFKSPDADMKKIACSCLVESVERCSSETLAGAAEPIIKAMLPNCRYRQNEIRKLTVDALSKLYVNSGVVDHLDKVDTLMQALTVDKNSAVRKSAIEFCKNLLVNHPQHSKLYNIFILTLCNFIYPLVPLRYLEVGIELPKKAITNESLLAFDALTSIGHKYEEEHPDECQDEPLNFGNERKIPCGLTKIIQQYYEKYLDSILPMISDWTESARLFSYRAMPSLLQLGQDYSSRYLPQMVTRFAKAIRDIRGCTNEVLQCHAILSTFTQGKDILDLLLSHVNNEGPKEMVSLLSVTTINNPLNIEELQSIIDTIMSARLFEALDSIDPFAQMILALVQKNEQFSNEHATKLLVIILKICEKSDALKFFTNSFGRPISEVFAEHLPELLNSEEKTPEYLTHLLLTSPAQAVAANQEIVYEALTNSLQTEDYVEKNKIHLIIIELAKRKAFPKVCEKLVARILEDMVWAPGKEKIPARENATYAVGALIEMMSIDDEMLTNDIDKILPMILSSMDDSWADVVRVAGIEAMKQFVARSTNDKDQFEKIHPALKERLDDQLAPVRIGAADILAAYLPKCVGNEKVLETFEPIIIFIDDDNEKIRESIARFIRAIANVPEYKDTITKILSAQQNYHEEANVLKDKLLCEINQ